MKLSVIIPHHFEEEKVFGFLLSSLNSQINVDFVNDIEVIICQDGKNFSFDFISKYSNILPNIKIIDTSIYNGNPGMSRQLGIDYAIGDYIMFCDADDLLPSSTVLYNVLNVIESKYDLYNFNFVQEIFNRKYTYSDVGENMTWVFGKAYSRKFLVKNNIRFSEDLIYHEDTYFNILFYAHEPKIFNSSLETYLWRCNPNSITRSNNGEYYYSSLPQFINAVDLADKQIDSLGIRTYQKKKELMIPFIGLMYGYLQHKSTVLDIYKEKIEQRLRQYIEVHDKNLDCLKEENLILIHQGILKTAENSNFIPKEGFEIFIKRILKKL